MVALQIVLLVVQIGLVMWALALVLRAQTLHKDAQDVADAYRKIVLSVNRDWNEVIGARTKGQQ